METIKPVYDKPAELQLKKACEYCKKKGKELRDLTPEEADKFIKYK